MPFFFQLGDFQIACRGKVSSAVVSDMCQRFQVELLESGSDRQLEWDFHRFDQKQIPNDQKLKTLFASSNWRLLQNEQANYLVSYAFSPPRPTWFAQSDLEFANMTVWCEGYETDQGWVFHLANVFNTLARVQLMYQLILNSFGLLLHTAALQIQDRIWLFPGYSGAGKSTLCKQFLAYPQPDCKIINDDRMIVRTDPEDQCTWKAYGTPWPGELEIALNQSAPLAAMCFLKQDQQSYFEPLTPRQALDYLLPVASIPWYDQDLVPKALDLCERLVSEIPVYVFHFRPDESAVVAILELTSR